MMTLKYFIILAALLSCVDLHSQLRNQDTIYYKYELTPTGKIDEKGDTVYNALILLSESDVVGIERLVMVDNSKELNLSLSEDTIAADPRMVRSQGGLKVEFGGWTRSSGFIVNGINKDNSLVAIQCIDEKFRLSRKSIDTVIKRIERPDFSDEEKPKAQL